MIRRTSQEAWFQSQRRARRRSSAIGATRFTLQVDGEVPLEILSIAERAVAEINASSSDVEARVASLQLGRALDDLRREGGQAWLESA